jgi:hypothetical protein
MSRLLALVLCALGAFVIPTPAQVSSSALEPLRFPAGTTLAFHLQTRLRHSDADPIEALPQGTVLHVKILNAIDSGVDRDGSEFHGLIVSDISIGDGVVIHSDAEVQGLLVLLRSKNHPDGFRYELLLTQITDGGKSYPLTASLNSSFFDTSAEPVSATPAAATTAASAPVATTKVETKDSAKPDVPSNTRLPASSSQQMPN